MKFGNKFNDDEQHDLIEFCRFLLEKMSEELNNSKVFIYEELNYENLSLNDAYNKYKKNDLLKENSIIKNIFYIYLNTTLKCKICNKISNSFEKYLIFL